MKSVEKSYKSEALVSAIVSYVLHVLLHIHLSPFRFHQSKLLVSFKGSFIHFKNLFKNENNKFNFGDHNLHFCIPL